jgi:hypothetical protein
MTLLVIQAIAQVAQTANAAASGDGSEQCQPSKGHPCRHLSNDSPECRPFCHRTSSHQVPPSTSNVPIVTSGNNIYVTWWSNKSGD